MKLTASQDTLFNKDDIDKMFTRISKPDLGFTTTAPISKKILTNNYKKYRNETAKKYKKVNGKWVENVPVTGGKRKTRKRK